MKLQKWLLALGMVGIVSFFLHTIFGITQLKGYNPITAYISVLTADGVPNVNLMRGFVSIYRICFMTFIFTLCVKSFQEYHVRTRIGYIILLIVASFSIIGLGIFPMTVDYMMSLQNIIHLIITIVIFSSTILAVFLLASGYLKKENKIVLGRLSQITVILIFVFSLMHLIAIMSGMNILGLMQRLSVYTFHIFTFVLSWIYVFRENSSAKRAKKHAIK